MSKDKKVVTFEELAVSNTLEIQAVIKILERKVLITSDEVLEEVSVLKELFYEKDINSLNTIQDINLVPFPFYWLILRMISMCFNCAVSDFEFKLVIG